MQLAPGLGAQGSRLGFGNMPLDQSFSSSVTSAIRSNNSRNSETVDPGQDVCHPGATQPVVIYVSSSCTFSEWPLSDQCTQSSGPLHNGPKLCTYTLEGTVLSTWRSGLHAITGDSRKAVTALSRFPSHAGVIDTELIVSNNHGGRHDSQQVWYVGFTGHLSAAFHISKRDNIHATWFHQLTKPVCLSSQGAAAAAVQAVVWVHTLWYVGSMGKSHSESKAHPSGAGGWS